LAMTLPLEALRMALARHRPSAGVIHHSDRGVQYASEAYRAVLDAHGVACSMSRRGNCYDTRRHREFFQLDETGAPRRAMADASRRTAGRG
jgi:putative transposase